MPAMTHIVVGDDTPDDWTPEGYDPRESDEPVPYEPAEPGPDVLDLYPDDYEYVDARVDTAVSA